MANPTNRVDYNVDANNIGRVFVKTWCEDSYYNDETAASRLWNKEFRTNPGVRRDGVIVENVTPAMVRAAVADYAQFVARVLGCDCVNR